MSIEPLVPSGLPAVNGVYGVYGVDARVRAVETEACLLAVALPADGSSDPALLGALAHDAVACGLLLVLSWIVGGARAVAFARRSFALRCDIAPSPWLDHLGTAVATGSALRMQPAQAGERYAVELDNGIERYTLSALVDPGHGELRGCSVVGRPGAVPSAEPAPGRSSSEVPVPLAEAIDGMRRHLTLPTVSAAASTGASGSATGSAGGPEHLAPWMRWQLAVLTRDLCAGPVNRALRAGPSPRAPHPSGLRLLSGGADAGIPDARGPVRSFAPGVPSPAARLRGDADVEPVGDRCTSGSSASQPVHTVEQIPARAAQLAAGALGTAFCDEAERLARELVVRAPQLLPRTRLRLWSAAIVFVLAEESALFEVECCASPASVARDLGTTLPTLRLKARAVRRALAPLAVVLPELY